MTVARLGAEMTSAELSEWRAFYRVEAEDQMRAMSEVKAKAGVAKSKAKGRR